MLLKNSLVALFGVFATLALANPEPQTPAQTTQLEQDIVSYVQALETDPAYISIAALFQTDTSAINAFSSWEASISSVLAHGETAAADFLSALPTEVQPFFGSVYTAEASIASKNGFPVRATSSATSKNAAKPTAHAVGAAAAGLAGFMGVVIAL